MNVTSSFIDGAWLVSGQRFVDTRGWFQELYTNSKLNDAIGIEFEVKQINLSHSHQGVVRGIHFSLSPQGQAKYVSVLDGVINDYVIDIRKGSPTFGQWQSFRLESSEPNSVLISPNLGHAFQVVSSTALVCYGVSSEYDPSNEHAISPLCSTLNVNWANRKLVLSDKDREAPDLITIEKQDLLPIYKS